MVAPVASRSSTGSGSCAKISIARSSSSGSAAIEASASIRRKVGQSGTSRTGRTAPVATRAPRGPSQPMSAGATTEPTAIAPRIRLSRMAKTRPSTSLSAERCTSVMPVTSVRIAPTPTSASRTSAGANEETAATTMSGTPQSRTPRANPPASLRLAASTATTAAPPMLPTPIAVVSQPSAAFPPCSVRSASTTRRT